jgi:hypothetical protein
VITHRDSQIVLAPPGGRGSIHWTCVGNKGWLAFCSPVSGRFLGCNLRGSLLCEAVRQKGWEDFCVRLRPEGGYALLMMSGTELWNVGSFAENGVEKLTMKVNESEAAVC